MLKKIEMLALFSILLAGCASVPMESAERTTTAKKFNPPSEGSSGLYIYRPSSLGGALKKDVWVDGKCIGETVPSVFFYKEVEGDKSHNVFYEPGFQENASETYLKNHGPPKGLSIEVKNGMNYFIRQYINSDGADLSLLMRSKVKKK
jgi:hypothetical protein